MSDFVVVSLVLRCKLEGWIFSTLSYSIQQNMMILSFDACIPFKLIIYFAVHFSSIEWNSMELFKQKYRTEKKGIAFVCQKRATKNFIFIKQNKEFISSLHFIQLSNVEIFHFCCCFSFSYSLHWGKWIVFRKSFLIKKLL